MGFVSNINVIANDIENVNNIATVAGISKDVAIVSIVSEDIPTVAKIPITDMQAANSNAPILQQFHRDVVDVNNSSLAPVLIKVDAIFNTSLAYIPSGTGEGYNTPNGRTFIPLYGRDATTGKLDKTVGTNNVSYGPVTISPDVDVIVGPNSTWKII